MMGFMSGTSANADPRCPRCRCDLRGEVAHWSTRCPLESVCTECGLAFEWKDIFSYARHPWLFEASWRYRPMRRISATVTSALRPRRFWRDVRMSDRIHLRPPGLVLLAVVLVAVLGPTALETYHDHSALLRSRRSPPHLTGHYWINLVSAAFAQIAGWTAGRFAAPILMLIGLPLTFLSVPITLGRARVRPGHIARIALYSVVGPLLILLTWLAVRAACATFGSTRLAFAVDPWMLRFRPSTDDHVLTVMLRMTWQPLALVAITTWWLWVWWSCAFRSYLRFDRTQRVLITMLVMAVLVGLTAAWSA